MKYLCYIFINIKSYVINHKSMFFLLICSITAAVIGLLFSYGLFLNTRNSSGEATSNQRCFNYSMTIYDENGEYGEAYAVQTNMKSNLDELLKIFDDDLVEIDISLQMADKNGKLHSTSCYYTPDNSNDLFNGKKGYILNAQTQAAENLAENGVITLDGIDYEVNQTNDDYVIDFIIPYEAINDDCLGLSLLIKLDDQPTRERVDEINDKCYELFNITYSSVPEASQLLKTQLNNMFYLYCGIITLIIIINLSLYFKYVLKTRSRQIFVFRACGGTSSSISIIFILEIIVELTLGFGLALLIFHSLGLPLCDKFYDSFSSFYSSKIYLVTFIIYLVVSCMAVAFITQPFIKKILNVRSKAK